MHPSGVQENFVPKNKTSDKPFPKISIRRFFGRELLAFNTQTIIDPLVFITIAVTPFKGKRLPLTLFWVYFLQGFNLGSTLGFLLKSYAFDIHEQRPSQFKFFRKLFRWFLSHECLLSLAVFSACHYPNYSFEFFWTDVCGCPERLPIHDCLITFWVQSSGWTSYTHQFLFEYFAHITNNFKLLILVCKLGIRDDCSVYKNNTGFQSPFGFGILRYFLLTKS